MKDPRLAHWHLLGVVQVVHLLVHADLRLVAELLVSFFHALAHVARRARVAGRGRPWNIRLFILEAQRGDLLRVRRLLQMGHGVGLLVGGSTVRGDVG